MTPYPPSIGIVLKINGRMLMASLCGFAAWVIWPDSIKWWGFGLLSIVLGVAAVTSLIAALRDMVQLYLRDRAIARFQAQGLAPKSSKLASPDALKKAGMRG